ncbi:hypothetical protein ACVWXO_007955 [Bradyrhizobium sp. LM2.7]
MTISGVLHDPASTLSSVIGFTVFPLFSGAKPPGRKTDHDKGQADNGCREFGGVFKPKNLTMAAPAALRSVSTIRPSRL